MIAVKADCEAVGERVDGSLAAAQTLATAKRS